MLSKLKKLPTSDDATAMKSCAAKCDYLADHCLAVLRSSVVRLRIEMTYCWLLLKRILYVNSAGCASMYVFAAEMSQSTIGRAERKGTQASCIRSAGRVTGQS